MIASFFIAILYGLGYYWIWYNLLKNAADTGSFGMSTAQMLDLVKYPVVLIVEGIWIVHWTFIHNKFFFVSKRRLFHILAKAMQRSLKELSRGAAPPPKPKELPAALRVILKNSYMISSVAHCIMAMVLLYFSVIGLLEDYNQKSVLIVDCMTIALIVICLPLTLAFNFSIMPIRNKLLILPLITMLSSIGLYYLHYYLSSLGTEWTAYGYFFWFGPAAYSIYMATLAMYTMLRRRYLYLIAAYGSLFILLPGYYISCYLSVKNPTSSYSTIGLIWFT